MSSGDEGGRIASRDGCLPNTPQRASLFARPNSALVLCVSVPLWFALTPKPHCHGRREIAQHEFPRAVVALAQHFSDRADLPKFLSSFLVHE